MRHEQVVNLKDKRSLITRRRFQLAGALLIAAIIPYVLRVTLTPESLTWLLAALNALIANTAAVIIAMWARLSIETYPGIRSSYVIFPVALASHGLMIAFFLLTRLPYDRVTLTAGFMLHIAWNYFVYFAGERRTRLRIAMVPFGAVEGLATIRTVDWVLLTHPHLDATHTCTAIVADFAAPMPNEWEAFLADAALAGRMVYQVKQLSESLTGRVELTHLSENSFGSLLPARGYFHLKTALDFIFALLALPFIIPLMAASAIAIKIHDGGPALFRQTRVGHAGKNITVYKFRTMRAVEGEDERIAAITSEKDERITRVGAFLRRNRFDELPQIVNILKLQMSWIGPRPEAEVLSIWYTHELPFYRYRHVVKPGISGWAQVNQGHVADLHDVHRKLQYDFYYIKNFSPWLDLLILFRTIKTMATGFGSR